jgi:alpha-tubulin suppressor-like RCC1 family protein
MPFTPPKARSIVPSFLRLLLAGLLLSQARAAAPEILTPPQPAEIPYRESAALTVQTSGNGVTLQWYSGTSGDISAPVPGATGPLLVSQPLNGNASFWVRATNADGHTDSPAATVTVRPPVSGRLLGMGKNNRHELFPTAGGSKVPKFIRDGATAVWAGTEHGLFTTSENWLYGMGNNYEAQLGNELEIVVANPRSVFSTFGAFPTHASAGSYHNLVLLSDGRLFGMGANYYGQSGTSPGSHNNPIQIASGVADAAAGGAHTAYVTTDGTLWTKGYNDYGQLGSGNTISVVQPVQAASGVARVHAGLHHTLFIKTDGSLWGMGRNVSGQLGDGSQQNRLLPVKIAEGVVFAAGGVEHSLFLTTDRILRGMGSNASGELGLSAADHPGTVLLPETIATEVRHAACGASHSFFITADNALHAMGDNSYGKLGDGTEEDRFEPVRIGLAVAAAANQHHSLFVDASPVISDQPDTVVILSGKTAIFSVDAEGAGPQTYQWYLGLPGDTSQPVAGATDNQFTTPALTADTSYWVRISSPYGYTDSTEAHALMSTKLSVKVPRKLSVPCLGNAVIRAEVTGPGLSFQWYRIKKGMSPSPVPGATSALLVTPPLAESASYRLRAWNAVRSVDSTPVAVTVEAPPQGSLMATGDNIHGQLGIGPAPNSPVFREIARDVAKHFAGYEQSYFITPEYGYFWAFGENRNHQLTTGSDPRQYVPTMSGYRFTAAASSGSPCYYLSSPGGELWSTSPTRIIAKGFASIHASPGIFIGLKTDGSLWGKGSNSYGQLGLGHTDSVSDLVRITGDVVAATTGGGHVLFIKSDGSLWGIGDGGSGLFGAPVDTPTYLPQLLVPSGVTRIAAGQAHSLFVKEDGSLWGFGSDLGGQLGIEGDSIHQSPVQIATGVVDVGAGTGFSVFLKSNHELWAMGENASGQLGDGTKINRHEPVLSARGVRTFSAGGRHNLVVVGKPAITRSPQFTAVAKGKRGQLSAVATSDSPVTWQWYIGESGDTSSPIPGATKPIYSTAVVTESYTVWARATNQYAYADTASALIKVVTKPVLASVSQAIPVRYGDHAALSVAASGEVLTYTWYEGKPGKASKPVATVQQPNFISRPLRASTSYWVRVSNAAGSVNSAAIPVTVLPREAATLTTFGRNQDGQLGDGTTTPSTVPLQVADRVVQVVTGPVNTYFLKDDGTLWGMGRNNVGQLGRPPTSPSTPELSPVQIASDVIDVVTGNIYILFIKSDRSLWGLGVNNHGQLGLGDRNSRNVPVRIATDVVQAAAGEGHSIFIKSNGSAWAMGRDTDGEQGNGPDQTLDMLVPMQIAANVAAAAAGEHYTVLLKCDGTLWAASQSTGSLVQVGTDIRAVACGYSHTLILKMDDSLWRLAATPVPIATGVESMAAGRDYSMFITREGQLYGMGSNSDGQLGDGSLTYQTTPIPLGPAYAVACGDYHSAVLVMEGDASSAAGATGRAAALPDPDGDSDGDGLSNLIEHAFASDSLPPGETPYSLGLQATESGPALVLTHRRLISAAVTFTYEWSDDLAEWQAFTPQLQVQPVDAEVEKVIVTRSIVPGEPAGFLRVRVLEK